MYLGLEIQNDVMKNKLFVSQKRYYLSLGALDCFNISQLVP